MDSEGLLELPALQELAGIDVGLVTAPEGRGLLAPALRERGAELLRADVYVREPIALSPLRTAPAARAAGAGLPGPDQRRRVAALCWRRRRRTSWRACAPRRWSRQAQRLQRFAREAGLLKWNWPKGRARANYLPPWRAASVSIRIANGRFSDKDAGVTEETILSTPKRGRAGSIALLLVVLLLGFAGLARLGGVAGAGNPRSRRPAAECRTTRRRTGTAHRSLAPRPARADPAHRRMRRPPTACCAMRCWA